MERLCPITCPYLGQSLLSRGYGTSIYLGHMPSVLQAGGQGTVKSLSRTTWDEGVAVPQWKEWSQKGGKEIEIIQVLIHGIVEYGEKEDG